MGTTSQKIQYLGETKDLLKYGINSIGGNITSQTTFRDYATELDSIYANLPKVSGTGTNISLSPTRKGRITSQINGDTLQDGTPTPSTPVAIQSVTGLQNVSVCGKNLFNKDSVTFSNGIYDDNGNYQASTSSWYTNNYYPVKSNTQYILSGTISTNGSPTRIYYYDKDKNWISRSASSSTNSITFTTPNNCRYIRIQVNNAISLNTGDVQLELGPTATTYEAFSGETYPINLGTIELNKIENYQDYISGTPNNWVVNQNIGNITFDGSSDEGWAASLNSNETYYTVRADISDMVPDNNWDADNPNIFDDKFNYVPYSDIYYANNEGISRYTGSNTNKRIYICIAKSRLDTTSAWLTAFRTWLSTNNLKVVYQLQTPTTTPITNQELITQLNNWYYAMSKNGETNISVDGNLPMILDVSALKGEE